MSDPWSNPAFLRSHYKWFLALPPEIFRTELVVHGLIGPEEVANLAATESRGPQAHNEQVMKYLRPRGKSSFITLLDVLREMGFEERCKELDKLVNSTQDRPAAEHWESPEFRASHYQWFLSLPSSSFRAKLVTHGLINLDQASTLAAMQSRGPLVHNEEALSYLRPGGRQSFTKFLKLLLDMGYDDRHQQFLQLVGSSSTSAESCTVSPIEEEVRAAPNADSFAAVIDGDQRSPADSSSKLKRSLWDLRSRMDFGKDVQGVLNDEQCRDLARELARRKGERNPDNYNDIIKRYLIDHNFRPAECTNVAGVLHYYFQKRNLTGNEFANIIGGISKDRADVVKRIIMKATFDDS